MAPTEHGGSSGSSGSSTQPQDVNTELWLCSDFPHSYRAFHWSCKQIDCSFQSLHLRHPASWATEFRKHPLLYPFTLGLIYTSFLSVKTPSKRHLFFSLCWLLCWLGLGPCWQTPPVFPEGVGEISVDVSASSCLGRMSRKAGAPELTLKQSNNGRRRKRTSPVLGLASFSVRFLHRHMATALILFTRPAFLFSGQFLSLRKTFQNSSSCTLERI